MKYIANIEIIGNENLLIQDCVYCVCVCVWLVGCAWVWGGSCVTTLGIRRYNKRMACSILEVQRRILNKSAIMAIFNKLKNQLKDVNCNLNLGR